MAKVDWITWKTDTTEIINPNDIIDKIDEIYEDYNCYMNSIVYEGLKHELTKGGLDPDSLNIVGISPANEYANTIMNRIENIKTTYENLKQKIYINVSDQKQLEKQQLIEAIENKIEEENRILDNTNTLKDKIIKSNNVLDINEVESIIEVTQDKITKLKERLERARSL